MTAITVSGLGSGISYDTWITQLVKLKQNDIDKVSAQVKAVTTKESALSTVETDYTDLKSAIETFTKALSTTSVFNQKTASSSSEAVKAKVDSTASIGDIKVTIDTLATATKAVSKNPAASYVDNNTKMSEISGGTAKAGTFSVYVDGNKTSIDIASDEKLGDVVTALNGITGVSANLSADGKLTIGASGASTVTVGSSVDTSNFSNVMSLVATTDQGITTYGSSKSIFDTDTSAALTSASFAGGTVKAGTFTIGNASFTIDATTTLNDLIKQINSNTDAGVSASWDPNAGKLNLTALDEGAVNINVEAGDGKVGDTDASNFTDIMGLTSSTWDVSNNLASTAIATDSQALGTNAKLTINGTTITSSSNTVTSDISGIKGLTLTLNDTTSSAADVAVAQDTSATSNAITKFVNTLNKVISDTDTATSSTGNLHGESVLTSLRNKLRTLVTASVGDTGTYNNLASIGITTGAIGTSVKADTNKLIIDTDALTKAIAADPDGVKKLLLGDTASGTTGVFAKLTDVIDNATNSANGYFTTREKSYEKQKSSLNNKIDTMTKKLTNYQKQLETKFAAMDKLISSLKNSSSIFDSYFNNKNSNSSSSTSN